MTTDRVLGDGWVEPTHDEQRAGAIARAAARLAPLLLDMRQERGQQSDQRQERARDVDRLNARPVRDLAERGGTEAAEACLRTVAGLRQLDAQLSA